MFLGLELKGRRKMKNKAEGSTAPDKSNSRDGGTSSSAIDSAKEQLGEFQAGPQHDRFLRTAWESGAEIVRVAASAGRRP